MSEPASVRPIEALSVVDRVTTELRRAIVCGTMRPNQEFSLREIAGQLGVSFIPVREALRTLEADGLLVTRRGRSAVVAPLDATELAGLCRLRRLIEPDLAARACSLMRPAELDRLEATIVAHSPFQSPNESLFEANLQFHRDLIRPATTRWDYKVLERLWLGVARYMYVGYPKLSDEQLQTHRPEVVQRELIAAFRTRDPETARAASEKQLDRDEAVAELALTDED
jgi:DNA-binding GntR family transcriptional regulator